MVSVFPVEKFARLVSPGAEPASMMNDVGGSPPACAAHVSVTLPLDEDAVKLIGAPGAVAGEAIAFRPLARGAEKHDGVDAPARHPAKSTVISGVVTALTLPNPLCVTGAGAAGVEALQLVSSRERPSDATRPRTNRCIGFPSMRERTQLC